MSKQKQVCDVPGLPTEDGLEIPILVHACPSGNAEQELEDIETMRKDLADLRQEYSVATILRQLEEK